MTRRSSERRNGPRAAVLTLLPAVVAVVLPVIAAPPASAGPCDPPNNAIVCENSQPGTPRDNWWLEANYGDIEGFTTQASVQPGERLDFKVKTPSADYTIEIFRLGYYQGNGARHVATLGPQAPQPRTQPLCTNDASSGLVDCGTWSVTASWQVPATAVPGFYVANFIRNDEPGASQYPFVVRKDTSTSAIVVQTSDQTWQAYNTYGDRPGVNEFSLYGGGWTGSSDGRAYKVSYNRPYRNYGTANFLNAEYPLLRWLERNGYDVSYLTGADITRNPALLRNHRVYISSGHDEYVNTAQRAGIEQAKAAGVHLMFLSGNEMFWKTRFESSIDGTHTPYRTLVSYKETKVGAKIDPSPEWTGTWRDPRLSPPADGGRPENGITGTLFLVNGYRNDRIEVPASFGRNRFWRNTSIATATTTTVLSEGTLGYEWDVDPDNGFRPAGAIRLSDTTVTVGPEQLLQDYGNTYTSGPATHNLLLYRDQASGALVFGAGTVQWAWGLDATHLNPIGQNPPTDGRIQQATVNLLADMGVQPQTLMPGLVPATASTDTTGPTVAVATPAPGATVPAGSTLTISGTAVDGGGQVASVEVSVDNGATWRRATGLDSWTFDWTPRTLGPATVQVRASDDSANLGAVQTRSFTVGPQVCPCTVFGTQTPARADSGEATSVELGMKFTTSVNATVTGVRFYKSAANTGSHTGSLWSASGQRLATGTFTGETASGWQSLTFASPIPIRANTTYVVSYNTTSGHYAADGGYFAGAAAGTVPVTAPSDQAAGGNGVFRYGGGFPSSSHNATNYWVDVTITTDGADNTPPTVTATSPTAGATAVPTDADIAATFSEDVDPASVRFDMRAGGGPAVLGTIATEGSTSTFMANDLLAPNTTYTVTLNATDGYGNALSPARVWSFTTGAGPTGCPCTIFRNARPGTVDAGDGGNVELGVKFTTSVPTRVTGVRFYKSEANTGVHTGSLWTASGQRLATGTFTGETASGWQTLTFPTPVSIRANTTYVASYHAPNGHYSFDADHFATSGSGRTPLTAPSSPASGGNGVYQYGSGFPVDTYRAANYWVDVVVDAHGADNTPPVVTGVTPAAGATGVATGASVTVGFDEQIEPADLTLTLSTGGSPVSGTTRVADDLRSATFTPNAPLAGNTSFTATVRAADIIGNPMPAAQTWSFTTGPAGSCPCTLFRGVDAPDATASDSPVELGMRWRPSTDGWVTGVRFYKALGDPGTHTGSLWTGTGQLLGTGTFTGESGSGWQTLTLATPVPVTAGTTYVVSYYASAGRYGYTWSYFTSDRTNGPLMAPASTESDRNGLYLYGNGGQFPSSGSNGSNYWVDVVFVTTQP
jgi:Domain of unknown function (DUF4082)/Bacterial Ig-like domain/Bacterial Ig domain